MGHLPEDLCGTPPLGRDSEWAGMEVEMGQGRKFAFKH